MRSFFVLAPLSAIFLLAAGAAMAEADPGSPPAPSASQPLTTAPLPPPATSSSRLDPNAVICKREEATGTRLGATKICHTRQEWADMSASARTSANDMQSRANLGIPPK